MASGGRVPNNSTSISLHERFSKLRSSAGGQRLTGKAQGARQNAAILQKTASRNNRQAQVMERRNASVAAALKLKKKSIKQRLGVTSLTNTRLRGSLTQNQRRLTTNRGIGRGAQRGSRAQVQSVTPSKISRGRGAVKFIASQTITRGAGQGVRRSTRGRTVSPNKRTAPVVTTTSRSPTKSIRGRGARRGGRVQAAPAQIESPVQRGRGRGRGQRQRGGGRGQLSQRGGNSPVKAASRGQSSGRGRGRGRGGATKVSKEDLDKQLDQYMSKSKGALDQDLESYMSKFQDVDMS